MPESSAGRWTEGTDTSAAQMHDWLKENYPKFPELSPKTVYNYVMKLRGDYSIPKMTIKERQYKALPLTPPGMYAQVDFGQKTLRTSNGTHSMKHYPFSAHFFSVFFRCLYYNVKTPLFITWKCH